MESFVIAGKARDVFKLIELKARVSNLARCHFCGLEGEYGKEVVDEDYHDRITGRDTTVCGCRDINACLTRQGK